MRIKAIADPRHEGCLLARNALGQVCRIRHDGTVRPVNSSEIDRWMGDPGYKRILEGHWPDEGRCADAGPLTMRELGFHAG